MTSYMYVITIIRLVITNQFVYVPSMIRFIMTIPLNSYHHSLPCWKCYSSTRCWREYFLALYRSLYETYSIIHCYHIFMIGDILLFFFSSSSFVNFSCSIYFFWCPIELLAWACSKSFYILLKLQKPSQTARLYQFLQY